MENKQENLEIKTLNKIEQITKFKDTVQNRLSIIIKTLKDYNNEKRIPSIEFTDHLDHKALSKIEDNPYMSDTALFQQIEERAKKDIFIYKKIALYHELVDTARFNKEELETLIEVAIQIYTSNNNTFSAEDIGIAMYNTIVDEFGYEEITKQYYLQTDLDINDAYQIIQDYFGV